jgi:hypothetical protein
LELKEETIDTSCADNFTKEKSYTCKCKRFWFVREIEHAREQIHEKPLLWKDTIFIAIDLAGQIGKSGYFALQMIFI